MEIWTMKDPKNIWNCSRKKYPTEQAVCRNHQSESNSRSLQKARSILWATCTRIWSFCHILNNRCSGVIREKVDLAFRGNALGYRPGKKSARWSTIPVEKLEMMKREPQQRRMVPCDPRRADWGLPAFSPQIYAFQSAVKRCRMSTLIFWMNWSMQKGWGRLNQVLPIIRISSILYGTLDSADAFIEVLAALIKRLAVDHLPHCRRHFWPWTMCRPDHGSSDELSLSGHWMGNHDILWMVAAAGSEACIATRHKETILK